MSKKVILKIWESNEMAAIFYNKEELFTGNFWDFHPYCYGSIIPVGDREIETGKHWKGYYHLADILARELDTSVMVKKMKGDWK